MIDKVPLLTKYYDRCVLVEVPFPVGDKRLDCDVVIGWHLESEGDPGSLGGTPENCHPPEPMEISIGEFCDLHFGKELSVSGVIVGELPPAFVNAIEEAVLEHAQAQ